MNLFLQLQSLPLVKKTPAMVNAFPLAAGAFFFWRGRYAWTARAARVTFPVAIILCASLTALLAGGQGGQGAHKLGRNLVERAHELGRRALHHEEQLDQQLLP